MGEWTDEIELGAALYEHHVKTREAELEKKKANDIYEYHTSKEGNKYRIADMDDSYVINCHRLFRKNHEYEKAFAFYIELRLRYPTNWKSILYSKS